MMCFNFVHEQVQNHVHHSQFIQKYWRVTAAIRAGNPRYQMPNIWTSSPERELLQLIKQLNLEDQVRLFGYGTGVVELNHIADALVFSSFREGLSVAPLEAMTWTTGSLF